MSSSVISALPSVTFKGTMPVGQQWVPIVQTLERGRKIRNIHVTDAYGQPLYCSTMEEAIAACDVEIAWILGAE